MSKWEPVHSSTDLGDLQHAETDGPLVPSQLRTTFRHEKRKVAVTLERRNQEDPNGYTLELERDNGPRTYYFTIVNVEVHTEGDGLASSDLRDIPLGEMVTNMLARLIMATHDVSHLSPQEMLELAGVPDVPDEVQQAWPDGDRDLVFKWVDLVYTAALMLGKPPTKTVGEKFNVNPTTGARLVKYARQAGVLTASSVNDPRKRRNRDQHGTSSNGNRGSRKD